jgi:hypothetical protein
MTRTEAFEHGSWGTRNVGRRSQATGENSRLRTLRTCCSELAMALELLVVRICKLVVRICKSAINPITNPSPVCSHSTVCFHTSCLLIFLVMKLGFIEWAPQGRKNFFYLKAKVSESWRIDPRFLDLGTSWRWVVSFTARPIYSWGKSPRYPLNRRMSNPQRRCGRCEELKILDPTRDSNPDPSVVQLIASHNTDCATAPLLRNAVTFKMLYFLS